MNKIALELKNSKEVKRYIELRKIITSNSDYLKLSKAELSLNEAKIENISVYEVINEYKELEKMIKDDLEMIGSIINEAIDINFLA